MTTLTGITPTPAQLADAHRDAFADELRAAAGADGRLSKSEAKRIADRAAPGWLAADNAASFFEETGQKTVSIEKLIGVIHADVRAEASAVAGPNQRLSLVEARALPADLQADFFYLRGKGLPERVEPADVKAWAEGKVKAALDDESATRLPAPPWQVMGKRPIIEHLPHPASHTHARVYVADDELYFSRAAPAGPGVPLVGWYHVGGLPPELRS